MKKILFIATLLCLSFAYADAQVIAFKSTTNNASDTVNNTGTEYVTTSKAVPNNALTTTVQVVVTKISGTVGGTISLQGSLDGTSYKALNTEETQTALATITATDATNVYHWRLKGNPFLWYRVSWTGTGTMSASFSAKILSH